MVSIAQRPVNVGPSGPLNRGAQIERTSQPGSLGCLSFGDMIRITGQRTGKGDPRPWLESSVVKKSLKHYAITDLKFDMCGGRIVNPSCEHKASANLILYYYLKMGNPMSANSGRRCIAKPPAL